MKKRILSIIIALSMCLSVLPTVAFASEGTSTASANAFTSLTVDGVNALSASSGSGWSYDASSSTLTITGGNIGAINATTAANSQEVLNVAVTGNATVNGGIYAGGKLNLVVNSGVTLTVNSSGDSHAIASGYHDVDDSLKITGGGTVVAISSGNGDGIKSGGGLWIEGVTVAAQGRNYGLDSGSGRLYIKDNSKVYAVSSQNTAIVAPSTEGHDVVEITGENTVVVAGFALGDVSTNYAPTTRTPSNDSIHAGTVTVNCGHLIIGGGFSATAFTPGSMTKVTDSSDNYAEYVGHLIHRPNTGGTHTPKCADGCPVSYTGTAEACSGTTYCTRTVCDKCGQTSGDGDNATHKGGEATCTAKAKCELCGVEYGEFDPTNHSGTASGNYTYVDGMYHSAVFDCCGMGGASANEEHTPSNENELICAQCNGLAIDRVLDEIKNAPSGTTLSYSGELGSGYSAYNKNISMEIPEGVTVNWGVEIEGTFSIASGTALLTLSGGGTLNLTGTIQNTATANQNACIALAANSNVTLVVTGGTVSTANSSASAIKADGGKEVRVESGTVSGTTGISLGTTANTAVTVTGGTVNGASSDAIFTANIAYSDTITVSGGTVTGNTSGIRTNGKVVISGTGTKISGTSGVGNAAIYAGSVEISGSPTIESTNGDGIKMYQSGPVVFKAGSNATVTGGQYGINDGLVTVEQGAEATVTGGSANGISYGGSGTITVNGELTVKSTSSYDAVYASSAVIAVGTSGKLKAESGSTSDGIDCKELQVSGTVEAAGGTTSGNGISATTLTINGGTVTASGYYAVNCLGTISVTDGVLQADGNRIGLCPNSSMTVSGDSHIVGTGTFKGASCANIGISDDHYWCCATAKPADLHNYTHGGLTGSNETNKTYFELVTKEHLEVGTIGPDTITCSCGDSFNTENCSGGEATCASGPVCTTCGVVYDEADDSGHVWGYSADDNVITVFCKNGCNTTFEIALNAPTARSGLKYSGVAQNLVEDGSVGTENMDMVYAVSFAKDTIPGTFASQVPSDTGAGTYYVYWKIVDAQGNDVISASVSNCIEVAIAKANLTVTANNRSITYGSEPENGGVAYGGFVNNEAEGVLEGPLGYEYTYAKGNDVGNYTITPKGLTSDNYEIEFVSGTLTVTPAEPAYTAPAAKSLTYNGEAQALVTAGSATGGKMQYSMVQAGTYSTDIPAATDAGTYTVYYKVVGDKNHKNVEPQSIEVTISPREVTAPTFADLEESYLYQNGSEIKPIFRLMDGDEEIPVSEYTVSYSNSTAIGTATVTIEDKTDGNYIVSGSATFEIVTHEHNWSFSASGTTITATCANTDGHCSDTVQSATLFVPESFTYTGDAASSATIEGSIDGVTLQVFYRGANTNYDSVNEPSDVDTYAVTLLADSASVSGTFTIRPRNIANCDASLSQDGFTYNGNAPELTVTVVDNGVGSATLTKDTDYTVDAAQVNAGNHKLIVTGAGNYTGTVELDYVISAKAITPAVEGVNASYTYTGKAIQPTVIVKDGGIALTAGVDYDVTCGNNTNVTDGGSVTVTLKGNYSGSRTVEFAISPKEVTAPRFDGLAAVYPYAGEPVEPSFKLMDGEAEIPAGEYAVSYRGNDAAGRATITVADVPGGNYLVSGQVSFELVASPVDAQPEAGEDGSGPSPEPELAPGPESAAPSSDSSSELAPSGDAVPVASLVALAVLALAAGVVAIILRSSRSQR